MCMYLCVDLFMCSKRDHDDVYVHEYVYVHVSVYGSVYVF